MQNICCGYSLEVPHRGASDEYPQHTFSRRNKKNVLRNTSSYLEVWHRSSISWKGVVEHLQNASIQISLHICTVSSGSVNSFYRIHNSGKEFVVVFFFFSQKLLEVFLFFDEDMLWVLITSLMSTTTKIYCLFVFFFVVFFCSCRNKKQSMGTHNHRNSVVESTHICVVEN